MKAVACTRYGPPETLELQERDLPLPGAAEIRIEIHATTVTRADTRIRSFSFPHQWLLSLPVGLGLGFGKPRQPVLGMELAGRVDLVGEAVTRFKRGDEVYAATLASLGGAYAQYVCVPEHGAVAIKPASLSFAQAAALPIGARTALQYLRLAQLAPGQRIAVYGASGSVGTYAVQLARHFGAHVTAVCSGANADMMVALGAQQVVDYTRADFADAGERYDVIFDTVDKCAFASCLKALTPGGAYLNATRLLPSAAMLLAKLRGRRILLSRSAPETAEALDYLAALVEAGALQVVIDRAYRLEEIVEAHRYVDQGRKRGNVSISVARPAAGAV
jgi:NADPH:quinone reductase-like Zn-dependent oxidoreductase